MPSLEETSNGLPSCQVLKSPGDGHCFLHSLSAALYETHMPLSIEAIKAKIFTETINTYDQYVPFLDSYTKTELISGLGKYLIQRHYNQSFGDIVPFICANALNVRIRIFNEISSATEEIYVTPPSVYSITVSVRRQNDHYDAVVPCPRDMQMAHSDVHHETTVAIENKPEVSHLSYSSFFLHSLSGYSNINRDVRKSLFKHHLWKPREKEPSPSQPKVNGSVQSPITNYQSRLPPIYYIRKLNGS